MHGHLIENTQFPGFLFHGIVQNHYS